MPKSTFPALGTNALGSPFATFPYMKLGACTRRSVAPAPAGELLAYRSGIGDLYMWVDARIAVPTGSGGLEMDTGGCVVWRWSVGEGAGRGRVRAVGTEELGADGDSGRVVGKGTCQGSITSACQYESLVQEVFEGVEIVFWGR
jgi:hypothetical protein